MWIGFYIQSKSVNFPDQVYTNSLEVIQTMLTYFSQAGLLQLEKHFLVLPGCVLFLYIFFLQTIPELHVLALQLYQHPALHTDILLSTIVELL